MTDILHPGFSEASLTVVKWYICIQNLTHLGRVTHICVGKLTIIGPHNGLSPGRRQAIIWTNAGILLIEPWGTNFSEILIGIQAFSFKKMHLKMSSVKWRPFCLGLNVLTCVFLRSWWPVSMIAHQVTSHDLEPMLSTMQTHPRQQCEFGQRWPNVVTTVPTLGQHWPNLHCCLGSVSPLRHYCSDVTKASGRRPITVKAIDSMFNILLGKTNNKENTIALH